MLPYYKQQKYLAYIRLIDVLLPIVTSFFFEFFNLNWRYLFLVTLLAAVGCFIGSFIIPESPRYLVNQNRSIMAKKSMKEIARWNGTYDQIEWKDFELEIPLSHYHHQRFRKYNDVWHDSLARGKLVILMINWFAVIMCLYSLIFILKYLSGSVFLNTRLSILGDVIGIMIVTMFY